MPTAIVHCDCTSAYQDRIYGTNQRLANQAGSIKTNLKYRCTVCGKEYGEGSKNIMKKNK